MKAEFDMALCLKPLLKGVHAARQRRIRQAKMQPQPNDVKVEQCLQLQFTIY
ncbi:hypothetical protein SRABI111_00774 [Pseudomonas carnis]|nr:hypothetical protein SRABI08_00531 [Pseudomonas carnis]CAH0153865.1 hypothetical protein SRABI111_00774 [Pseudomonas carnis]CAH0213599.1 hypothetical protein SRABI64_02041 [Pseudomonas carnis]CAH0226578.1 hypothetical protein SRABI110_02622 [Pseudomonas carnis]